MDNSCKFCCKAILRQPYLKCCICNQYYHKRCVISDIYTDNLSWFCMACTGSIFPFNHYIDDDEFNFALFTNACSIEFDRMLNLKFNPFTFDLAHNYNLNNFNTNKKCSYYFDRRDLNFTDLTDFSIFHINSRSFCKNFDNIHELLSSFEDKPFSVISMSETWYKPDNSNIINLENYNLHHTARQDRRSGGAAIYVHNSLSFRIRNDLNLIQNRTNELDHCESVFIEIILPNKKNIIVGNIYRAHRTNTVSFLHDLNACLSKVSIENKPCYISGDFNFDLLKFDLNDTINDFLSKFYDHNMFPLIDRPTRITSSSATLLDNIFCNCFTHKIKSGVLISDLTDHYPIFQCTSSNLHFVRNKLPPDKSRLFNRNRLDCFTDSIKQINWDDILSFNSTVDAYNAFIHKFLLAYNRYFR